MFCFKGFMGLKKKNEKANSIVYECVLVVCTFTHEAIKNVFYGGSTVGKKLKFK